MMLRTFVYLIWVAAGGNAPADVTELRIEPVAEYTELVIRTTEEVAYSDFLLSSPPRLIVDIKGARHALPNDNYENINRGGVIRLRTSQFRDDVVRVVVELVELTSYDLTRIGNEIRVSFPNPEGLGFEPWASGAREVDPSLAAVGSGEPSPGGGSALAIPAATLASADRVLVSETDAVARALQQMSAQSNVIRQTESPISQMPRITVTFESTDIRDVLNNFAEFTGKSFVPGAGVEGAVTANIRNQPWDVALKAILDSQGLTAVESATGIIRVDRLENLQERQQLIQLETQIFKINYTPVSDLANALQAVISDRGKTIPNEATNSVIVTDLPENIAVIRQMIEDLDVRTPQVVINAKIIFVDRQDISALGIIYDLKDTGGNQLNRIIDGPTTDPREWELIDADFDGIPETIVKPLTQANQVSFSGSSVAALANADATIDPTSLEVLVASAIGDFRLFTFIQVLQQNSLSDIIAAPTIQTMDNQPARVLVGERTPVRVIDAGAGGATGGGAGQGASAQFPTATVTFEETGIKLEVTPHITANRQIVLDLHAERSGVVAAAADIGFTFQTQEAETRLILSDGETGVIGGLTISDVTEQVSGIPFLMDLPLIGPLFRSRTSKETKQDLLILVTPHIVDSR